MRPRRLWNRRYVHLLLIEAVFQFATYLMNPIVSAYVMQLGASLAAAGFVAGLVASSALAVRPLTGWVADRLSKPALLVLAAALFAASALGCACAPTVAWMGLFRIVQGVAFALRSAVAVSLVSTVVARDHLGRAVGWVGVVTTASCAVAPAVAAALAARIGCSACFALAAALFAGGLALAVLFARGAAAGRRRAGQDGERVRGAKPRLRLRDLWYVPAVPFSILAALAGVPHGINVSLLLVVGECRAIEGIALYFALYALAALVARPLAGRASDMRGLGAVLVPALLVDLAGVAVLVVMDSLAAAALAGVLVGVGQGSAHSSLQAEAVRGADEGESGRASNTFYLGPDVNMGLSPFVGGLVMQAWGVSAMYGACFVLVSASLVLFVLMKRKTLIAWSRWLR